MKIRNACHKHKSHPSNYTNDTYILCFAERVIVCFIHIRQDYRIGNESLHYTSAHEAAMTCIVNSSQLSTENW